MVLKGILVRSPNHLKQHLPNGTVCNVACVYFQQPRKWNLAGCKDDEATGLPDGASSDVANGADAVREVLQTALQEILMEFGQNGTSRSRSGRTDSVAFGQLVGGPSSCRESGAVVGGNATSFSFPPRAEKGTRTRLETQGEESGATAADEAPLSRTKANFMEFVLERMLFGVMQEVVAGDTEVWDV